MGPQPRDLHPILACAEAMEAALKDAAGVDPAFMRTGEKAEAMRRLDRLESRMAALRMRVMANADDVPEATADHSVATWLAAETRTDPRDRAGELALARSLERRWTRLAADVADGSVHLSQARVISRALEDLPTAEVGPQDIARAEEALIGYAAQHAPRQLGRLGRRILEVAAPELCELAEGRALEREERRAAAVTSLSLCAHWGTAPPGSAAGSPTRWQAGCAPTSTPTPHRATRAWARATGCRRGAAGGRRSAPSWRTSTAPAYPSTAATRPRSWSPSTSRP